MKHLDLIEEISIFLLSLCELLPEDYRVLLIGANGPKYEFCEFFSAHIGFHGVCGRRPQCNNPTKATFRRILIELDSGPRCGAI